MSLLDVIKYPITADFSPADMNRIPAPILIKWWMNSPYLEQIRHHFPYATSIIRCPSTTNFSRAGYISGVLVGFSIKSRIEILKSLKKYIEEYESV